MKLERLDRKRTGMLVVDVQDKLLNAVERRCDLLGAIRKLVKGVQILGVPVVVSEQYPEGLGGTEKRLKECLGEHQAYFGKTVFSAWGDPAIEKAMRALQCDQWIVVGIEAHVCILQTVRVLLQQQYAVVVPNDCISSRSIYDYSTAIAEMRDLGARISSAETVIFELVHDARAPEFKQISQLIQCS
jgi:nicotinamidase-related amidase